LLEGENKMKKIVTSLMLSLFLIPYAFAYQVEVTETKSYEFEAAGKAKESPLNTINYEIDEENEIVIEGNIVGSLNGKRVNTGGGSEYKIIKNMNSNIAAVRIWENGEALVQFDNEGNFYHFTSFRVPMFNTYFSQVAFGEYKRK